MQVHPLDLQTPSTLYRSLKVSTNGKTTLKIRASYHPHGDWTLRIRVGKDIILEQLVSYKEVQAEWLNLEIDLTPYAGKTIDLSLDNKANNWSNEFGFWHSVKISTK
ncbi:MAG: hypothetical protein QNK82_17185 [Akkermansiaceae bacterium]